jgi:hypothetical protein
MQSFYPPILYDLMIEQRCAKEFKEDLQKIIYLSNEYAIFQKQFKCDFFIPIQKPSFNKLFMSK